MRNMVEQGDQRVERDHGLVGRLGVEALDEVDLGAHADGGAHGRRALARMVKSVDPTESASSLLSWAHSGVHDDEGVGVLGPEGLDVLGRKRWCTERSGPPEQERGLLCSRPRSARRGRSAGSRPACRPQPIW